MNTSIPDTKKVSSFYAFFLISTMQFGIGILGYQRVITKNAGQDSWISVLLTGSLVLVIVWMMLKMLKFVNGDIISIHMFVFGRKVGKYINIVFMFYFYLLAITVLRNYIEIVQVWMFPELSTTLFAALLLILVLYIIFGGFRTISGMAFFSIVLPTYIMVMFFFTIPFADFTNLLPVMNHSVKELLLSSRDMSLTVIGFETLLFFYPFIKNPEKARKWVYFAILATTLVYTLLLIMTIAYFSYGQLQKNIWPTLTMWKIVQLPFIERFEYIGIANWLIIILPNICIPIWCISRLGKQLFSFNQRKFAPIICLLCLIGVSLFEKREHINLLSDFTAQIGFYFNFVYIPILFLLVLVMKKVKNC